MNKLGESNERLRHFNLNVGITEAELKLIENEAQIDKFAPAFGESDRLLNPPSVEDFMVRMFYGALFDLKRSKQEKST